MSRPDLLVIAPGNGRLIYQELAEEYAAIEPPIWAGMLANSARHAGYEVAIVDQEAEGLSAKEIAARAGRLDPRLVAIVVYGQQPSASTQTMTAAGEVAAALRREGTDAPVVILGGHPSALPERTLLETEVDAVCEGEGPHTLRALLALDDPSDRRRWDDVPGLWYRADGAVKSNPRAPLIPAERLPELLPGVAWDLLPMERYRAHNWHCFGHLDRRTPYGSIYTSLGCPFRCSFCCINAPFGKSSFRYWPPEFTVGQIKQLRTEYGVRNLKIADEMFVLNEKHYLAICEGIVREGIDDLNIWAYARVDTVKSEPLALMRKAGVRWLCLGIESASRFVRDGVRKGKFGREQIFDTVKRIRDAGIFVIGNFIFGLPDDTFDSMQETLDIAMELNCEMANFYCATAYPGSALYERAVAEGWPLPAEWHHYSQHSRWTRPLPTETLSGEQVLAFRDWAWQVYFTNPRYLEMIRRTFGTETVRHIRRLTEIRLEREFAWTPEMEEARVAQIA
ncbi:MAG: radical SAM protein [Acidobacteria bacterium]|nr:MAG: radical SAM protein [Acidobacteriota bacterium]